MVPASVFIAETIGASLSVLQDLERKPRVPDFTEEWLETPTAFWLHPEGPLSDTTREEWVAKEVNRLRKRRHYQPQPYSLDTGPDYSMMAPIAMLGVLALSS